MINGQNKNRGIENPTKRVVPSVQGIVKIHLEVVEVENASLYPRIFSLNYELTVECPRLR